VKDVFPIIPAHSGPAWFLAILAVLLTGLLILFAWTVWSSRNLKFEVRPDGLHIVGGLYGRIIPADSLIVDQVRVFDLRTDSEHQFKWRTNGVGLPGYKAGWFRLRNGEKSLVFITDQAQVVYLPTRDGYSLLLSPMEPQRFLEALRRIRR
jgi:hypothetical protein